MTKFTLPATHFRPTLNLTFRDILCKLFTINDFDKSLELAIFFLKVLEMQDGIYKKIIMIEYENYLDRECADFLAFYYENKVIPIFQPECDVKSAIAYFKNVRRLPQCIYDIAGLRFLDYKIDEDQGDYDEKLEKTDSTMQSSKTGILNLNNDDSMPASSRLASFDTKNDISNKTHAQSLELAETRIRSLEVAKLKEKYAFFDPDASLSRLMRIHIEKEDLSCFDSYTVKNEELILEIQTVKIFLKLCGDLQCPQWAVYKSECEDINFNVDVLNACPNLTFLNNFVKNYLATHRLKDIYSHYNSRSSKTKMIGVFNNFELVFYDIVRFSGKLVDNRDLYFLGKKQIRTYNINTIKNIYDLRCMRESIIFILKTAKDLIQSKVVSSDIDKLIAIYSRMLRIYARIHDNNDFAVENKNKKLLNIDRLHHILLEYFGSNSSNKQSSPQKNSKESLSEAFGSSQSFDSNKRIKLENSSSDSLNDSSESIGSPISYINTSYEELCFMRKEIHKCGSISKNIINTIITATEISTFKGITINNTVIPNLSKIKPQLYEFMLETNFYNLLNIDKSFTIYKNYNDIRFGSKNILVKKEAFFIVIKLENLYFDAIKCRLMCGQFVSLRTYEYVELKIIKIDNKIEVVHEKPENSEYLCVNELQEFVSANIDLLILMYEFRGRYAKLQDSSLVVEDDGQLVEITH